MKIIWVVLVAVLLFSGTRLMAENELVDIPNYREYSPLFSSSGQPSAEQLESVSRAGFERVIYLAFSDNQTAIEAEDRVVKGLGMDYVHIPVDFEQPTLEDFEDFAAVINRDLQRRTLLHCQINLRASTFSFLYRVIYGGVPMVEAKEALDGIWVPDQVWYQFIVDVLKHHDMSHQCPECDWAENELEG
ncbi:MAG: phosphatase [Halieaceae bacterium]|jgi:protein tyrosine phosphatase (PTP) superfamily phosphohydrolase (DUF442 family)|nr:phosphatase [Halieaceae bacterium]